MCPPLSPSLKYCIFPPGPLHLILLRTSPWLYALATRSSLTPASRDNSASNSSSRAVSNGNSPLEATCAPRSALPTHDVEEYSSILLDAASLETRLAKWPALIPPSWHAVTVSSSDCVDASIRRTGMYGTSCDIYPSIGIAGLWNWYRTLRLSTIKIVMICHRKLAATPPSRGKEVPLRVLRETIQTLVDEFCNSIPFHLGNCDGVTLPEDHNTILYPQLPPNADETFSQPRCATAASTAEHKRSALLSGRWYLLDPLREILSITAPVPNSYNPSGAQEQPSPPLTNLREGQREWLEAQMRRIASMELRGQNRDSSSEKSISPKVQTHHGTERTCESINGKSTTC